ncbi:MAG TPA: hypothetical protein VFD88_02740, partial [Clostridia bacterium]|nr:hypothetical protein [Clostridia bacterium]
LPQPHVSLLPPHVSETPFDFAIQLGSGVAFVLLWRLRPGVWSRLARLPFYYRGRLNSLLGIVPLVIAAVWLMYGVLMPLAGGMFGDRPTGGAQTEWFVFVLWPLGLSAIAFIVGRPVWLQPPGCWHVLNPNFTPARWWRWVLPTVVCVAVLVSGVIGAVTSAGVSPPAAVATLLVLAAGFLIPPRVGRVTVVADERE